MSVVFFTQDWYCSLNVLHLGKLHRVLSSGAVIFHVLSSSVQYLLRGRNALSNIQVLLLSIFSNTYSMLSPFRFFLSQFFLSFFPLFFLISFSLSSLLPLIPFSVCHPSALSCWDKLMYKFPIAPHHGWLPYQGQESALQHLQHFIGTLSKCRGRRESKPVGYNSLMKLIKPFTVFDDRPWVSLMFLVLNPHRPGDHYRLIFSP